MIFPDVEPEDWSKKYDLPIEEVECRKCGKTFNRNVPIVTKFGRGFVIEEHGCGKAHLNFIGRPEGKLLKAIEDIL